MKPILLDKYYPVFDVYHSTYTDIIGKPNIVIWYHYNYNCPWCNTDLSCLTHVVYRHNNNQMRRRIRCVCGGIFWTTYYRDDMENIMCVFSKIEDLKGLIEL